MRIAQIATVSSPVRRDHAGSVETIVWLLAKELTRMGHDVTVFGCAGSECAGTFVETMPASYGEEGVPDDWNTCEWLSTSRAVSRAREFDVIHSHAYLWGLPLTELSSVPMLHTLHILPYDSEAQLWRHYPDAKVSAISQFQWRDYPELQPLGTVPHGVDPAQFALGDSPEDYLLYLGRFIPNKGPNIAIDVARQSGRRLILAGPENAYFDAEIRPHVDGRQIMYAGAVDSDQRKRLLQKAAALIYPLIEPEPFGLVQIEAFFCGTPVIAFPIGAVPEIVEHGVSGFLCRDIQEMVVATQKIARIDRAAVARIAGDRFSANTMARSYIDLYRQIAL